MATCYCLEGPHYLNDQIIEFFFSYLTAKLTDNSSRLLLVGPVITYWLLHCPDSQSLNDAITPLQLHNREPVRNWSPESTRTCLQTEFHHGVDEVSQFVTDYVKCEDDHFASNFCSGLTFGPLRQMVIFSLNNNEDVDVAEGGSHWTLLVYSRHGNVFEHYDSLAEINASEAQNLRAVVKPFLGGEASQAKLIEPTTPQQVNGYDCGVYVMAIAQVLCNSFQEKQRAVTSHDVAGVIQTQVTSSSVHKMRSCTCDIISQLSCNSSSRKTCNSSN